MSDWEVAPEASEWAVVDEPEEGGPESFLDPKKFKPSPSRRKFNNTGPIEKVRAELDPAQLNPDPAKELSVAMEQASGPFLSAADRFTGGALGSTLKLDAETPIPESVEGPITGGAPARDRSRRALESIDRYRRESPVASNVTDMAGYMSGAPRAIATAVESALPRAVHPLAQMARATVASGVSSAGVAGVESAQRGDEPSEILREAGRGYVGGTAVGAPLSAASGMAGAAARAILGSKGARAREYLTSRGQPLTAPDTSDAAIGAAAQRTDEAVKNRLAGYRSEVASGPYLSEINKVTPEQANELVNIDSIYNNLSRAAGDPANLQVADKLRTLMGMLDDRRMTAADGSEPVMMTQEQLNGLRRSLGSIASIGESTAPQKSALRQAFADTKAMVDQGPYATANRVNTEGMRDFNESLDMVGLTRSFDPDEPIKGNLRVAAQRQGQNTVTAGGDTERLDLEAFKAKHPDLANVIDAPEIIRNQGDLAFHAGGPSHGGLIDRLTGHLPLPAVIAASALGHGLEGAAAAAAMMAYQNRNAIAGRVLYNPAQRAQLAAQLMLGEVPALSAPGRETIQERR